MILFNPKCILFLGVVFGVRASYPVFHADDANEQIKLIIQTIKAININPYDASNDDIRMCVEANFSEEDSSSSQIESLCESVRLYIELKKTELDHSINH